MRKERRGHPRYDMMAQVRATDGDVTHILDIENISMAGLLLVVTDLDGVPPLSVGQLLDLHIFDTAELDNLHLSGRVTREQLAGGRRGYGVAFEALDEPSSEALRRLVEMARQASIHPPPLPSD